MRTITSHTHRTEPKPGAWLVVLASLVGLGVFLYPFALPTINQTESGSARSGEAPIVLCGLIVLCLGAILIEFDPRAVGVSPARNVALLATLVSLGAIARLIPSFLGASPVFLLVILGGFVFGPVFGFQVGALTLALSAFLTGGIGPWVPYQMLAVGWVGLGAGCLPRLGSLRRDRLVLIAYGVVSAVLFGALMNLWFWPFAAPGGEVASGFAWSPALSIEETLSRYAHFYVATSLVFDLFRALGNGVLLAVIGPRVVETLHRYQRSLTWTEFGEHQTATFHNDIGECSPGNC
jgi:energy-coupling factor transport system substrate-specific component